ncbi:MAG: molybdopterin-binding protein [Alphaproteobacteria bacterium]
MDDIFNAIRLIKKYLPKPSYTLKNTKSLTCRDLINDRFTLKENIPPYNQSAMDGIGVISKKNTYILKGKTLLDKYIDYKIKDNECVIVKTGSLIPNSIKYIIPCEVYFQNKNLFHILKYDFKNSFIRKKGHVFKSGQKFILKNKNLSKKDLFIYNSFKNISLKTKNNLSFKIISTGNEFTKNHFINPTNATYLESYLYSHNQKIDKNIHIKDDQRILEKELNNSKSDITIVIGGTGKSEDDFNFKNFKLLIDGLNLKPGRPFKSFIRNKQIFLFFPGNPCSSFVLTNILVNSLILKYQFSKNLIFDKEIDIKKIKFNFNSLMRKSFLFGFIKNDQNIKIFNNQESSNISNILKSNCLIYFNKTKKLKIYKLNDK